MVTIIVSLAKVKLIVMGLNLFSSGDGTHSVLMIIVTIIIRPTAVNELSDTKPN
jgi:hypothetical protein